MTSQTQYLFDRTYSTEYIKLVQRALNANTYTIANRKPLVIDGVFGEATISLLKDFQEHRRFEVTGTYTARSSAFLNEYIEKRFLTFAQFSALCLQFNVDPAMIRACLDLQGSSHGYTTEGQAVMQLDLSAFNLELKKIMGPVTLKALHKTHPVLFNDALEPSPEEHWVRVQQARLIEERPALSSTLFGLGKVPGDSYMMAGARSIMELMAKCQESEANQLTALLWYYHRHDYPLVKSFERLDWMSIAAILFPQHQDRRARAAELNEAYHQRRIEFR